MALRLAPAVEWTESAACFPTWEQAYRFCEILAVDSSWTKRLVTVFEWPIPAFLTPFQEYTRTGQALALMMAGRGSQFDPRLLDGFVALAPILQPRAGRDGPPTPV